MKQIKTISIPTPCHEPWQNMMPDATGRYCQACAKSVIDFTVMTDQQIIDYFTATPNVCGRFDVHQLNHLNHKLEVNNMQQGNWIKRLMLAASLLTLSAFTKLSAQSKPAQYQTDTVNANKYIPEDEVFAPIDSTHNRLISGRVNNYGQALAGVKVQVTETDLYTYTDSAGRFNIILPFYVSDRQWLTFSYEGYGSTNWSISHVKNNPVIGLTMLRREVTGGAMYTVRMVSVPFYKRLYQRFILRPIKKLF